MLLKNPWILLLIPIVIPLLIWWQRRRRPAALRFPSLALTKGLRKGWRQRLLKLPFICRLFAIVLMVIALSGPRDVLDETKYVAEGIDIMLAIDTSKSLASEDFMLRGRRYNRLEVIKSVVEGFIEARTHDRIGIVAFAGRAYTVSPLTKDYEWLKSNLQRIEFDLIEDGTAIGSALMSSIIRLRQSEAKSKVVVLLTDGVNNSGKVSPLEAAKAAKALGIRVYTIGAGTKGVIEQPVRSFFGQTIYRRVKTDVDEETLQEIALTTGAKFFRATDTESLRQIYKEVDELERTEFEELGYREYQELFPYFVFSALAFLIIELVLNQTILMKVP